MLVPETDPPALVPEMVAQCRANDGMVNGVDATATTSAGPLRRLFKRAFHGYMRRFLKVELLPGATDFRVFSRRMVNALTQIRESHWQLRLLSSAVGYGRTSFVYTPLSRSGRIARRSWLADIGQAVEMVIAHSRQPLRVASLVGWAASALNGLYVLYAALIYLFKPHVAEGWTSLAMVQGVMFFCVFTILALLSEYVGRILEQSRGRPLYFVCDEKNSHVLLPDQDRPNIVHDTE